jgi:hypothetical protein
MMCEADVKVWVPHSVPVKGAVWHPAEHAF